MSFFRLLLVAAVVTPAFSCVPVSAQDVAAAVAPASVTNGPRLIVVQKTLNALRWRALNAATTGWEPWTSAAIPGTHYDGEDRVAIAGWSDNGTARYNAFEAIVAPGGAIEVAETRWDFGHPNPVNLPSPHTAPANSVGSLFFPADAVGRTFDRGFSAFGTSAAFIGNNLVFTARELFRANPVLFRDMDHAGGSTPEVFFSAFSTTLRDSALASFDRTTAVMHQHTSGSGTVSLYSQSNVIVAGNLDAKLAMGSPPGVMTQAPLLFIHDPVNPGPMNLFTIARDATGRRRLFERSAGSNPTQLANWSAWKDWGFPAGAPAAAADDLEMVAPLVWRMPGTNVLRVNMFGTRGGQVVERHWNGTGWNWGALLPLPASGIRLTDGAVVTRGSNLPRLSVFGVTPSGAVFELFFDWNQGRWIWQALN